MTPKKMRSATSKAKELETATTPLIQRLENISKAKVQETSWARLWEEIKKWAYIDKKMTLEAQKVNSGTIMSYINAPLMASFGGTKEIISKFIISQYHNGKFLLRQTH